MFTVVGWEQSITSTALAARNALTSDQSIAIRNSTDIVVPDALGFLKGAYGMGVDLANCRLSAPSLLSMFPFDLQPVDEAALPTAPLLPWVDLWDNPYPLKPGEGLQALLANEAAGANIVRAAVWLGDDKDDVPQGPMLSVRATGTTTLVAETWTAVPLTFPSSIPVGRWAVVGARFAAATAIVGRLIFPGALNTIRPGAPACAGAEGDTLIDLPRFRMGRSGLWGTFVNAAPPQAEFWATAGDTAEVVTLDLVFLGGLT